HMEEKPEGFPWFLLTVFGAILLLILLAEVIHHSHKGKDRVEFRTMEDGFRNLYFSLHLARENMLFSPKAFSFGVQ
ncbi:unnamed protein product, partial [marine sediment metagenome]